MDPDRDQNDSGETCRYHSGHEKELEAHDERITRLENAMVEIRNRLPVWATLAIAALTGGMGVLATVIATLLK